MSKNVRPSNEFDVELLKLFAGMSEGTIQGLRDAMAFKQAGASAEEAARKGFETIMAEVNAGEQLRKLRAK